MRNPRSGSKADRYLSKGLAHPRSCWPEVHADNLIGRLELLILETNAGHAGLYEEMLNISKQLLSMNVINQEKLDNFVFNYGK